jgi:uncharacterized protein (TIGR03437 family)
LRAQLWETILAFFLVVFLGFGQSGAVVGAAYLTPTPLAVAPGQLLTVFVAGVGQGITQRVSADVIPLPTTLGGLSVSWSQLGQPPAPVPLLAVFPIGTCTQGAPSPPCSTLIGITLQIPYELYVYQSGTLGVVVWAELIVSDKNATARVDFYGLEPIPHVVRFGDTILSQARSDADAVVSHADGTIVTVGAPARVGEDLTLYATGLGRTTPTVNAGDPGPLPPAKTLQEFQLAFDYGLNPSMFVYPPYAHAYPVPSPQTVSLSATQLSDGLSAWLVPGLAGIYQVNFRVPPAPPGLPPCGGSVRSNLTITFVGTPEFAAICVDTVTANATRPAAHSSIHVPTALANFPRTTEVRRR